MIDYTNINNFTSILLERVRIIQVYDIVIVVTIELDPLSLNTSELSDIHLTVYVCKAFGRYHGISPTEMASLGVCLEHCIETSSYTKPVTVEVIAFNRMKDMIKYGTYHGLYNIGISVKKLKFSVQVVEDDITVYTKNELEYVMESSEGPNYTMVPTMRSGAF